MPAIMEINKEIKISTSLTPFPPEGDTALLRYHIIYAKGMDIRTKTLKDMRGGHTIFMLLTKQIKTSPCEKTHFNKLVTVQEKIIKEL